MTTIRAAVAVVMLAGFYLLAVGLLGAVGAASWWLWQHEPGAGAAKVSLVALLLAGGLVAGMWKAARARPAPPEGLGVPSYRAPMLWHTLDELSAAVGTRRPDEVRMVPDVNAAVAEDTRLLGLVGGRRVLYLGVPLVQALSVAQLRSVLAHELGHYSSSHTRLGALAHRGRMVIVQTVKQTHSGVFGWVLLQYAKLYVLVEQAVSRRQEFEADAFSVRVAGREPAASALRELPILDAAWDFYLERYVSPGWQRGYAPADLLGGFRRLLAGRAELAALRLEAPSAKRSRWDSHPPIADRIAAILARPETGPPPDTRPASILIPDMPELTARLEGLMLDLDGRTVLPWEDFAPLASTQTVQPRADALLRAAARLAGRPGGDLGLVLHLVAAGRGADLARGADPHGSPDAAQATLRDGIGAAIMVAAVGCGVARWRPSWSGPAELVDAAGRPIEVAEIAALAAAPAGVAEAGRQLTALGIPASAGREHRAQADPTGAEVLGGLANMKSESGPLDVLILDRGLILAAAPKKAASMKSEGGKQRMVELLRSASVAELARRYRFLPYEEIASADITKRIPIRVALILHSGERLSLSEPWSGDHLGKDANVLLAQALAPFVAGPPS